MPPQTEDNIGHVRLSAAAGEVSLDRPTKYDAVSAELLLPILGLPQPDRFPGPDPFEPAPTPPTAPADLHMDELYVAGAGTSAHGCVAWDSTGPRDRDETEFQTRVPGRSCRRRRRRTGCDGRETRR